MNGTGWGLLPGTAGRGWGPAGALLWCRAQRAGPGRQVEELAQGTGPPECANYVTARMVSVLINNTAVPSRREPISQKLPLWARALPAHWEQREGTGQSPPYTARQGVRKAPAVGVHPAGLLLPAGCPTGRWSSGPAPYGPRVGWSGGRGREAGARTARTRGAAAGEPSGALGCFRERSVCFGSLRQYPAARGGLGPPRRGGAQLSSARLGSPELVRTQLGPAMASPSRRLQTKPVITCLKSVLLTYTFVFWVSGIVLLAVGVWGSVSLAVYFSLLDEKATNVPFVLVGAGVVVVLLGTFGCFATCRGSTWMLKLYAMLLSLIFLIVLVAAVVGFVFRHEIKTNFESNLKLALKNYNGTADHHSEAVDTIQKTLKCCGVQNYSDWEKTEYFTQKGIPQSCCKSQDDCMVEDLRDPSKAEQKVFVDGCFVLVTSTMESKMSVVAGISFGIACFQLVGIILACCLSQYITNNQYEMV